MTASIRTTRPRRLRRSVALAATAVLALTACSDTSDGEDDTTEEDGGEEAAGATVEVTTTDYAFGGVPAEVEAGTTFTIRNDSEGEVHEVLALKLAEGDDRDLGTILELGEAMMAEVELRGVLVAGPGDSAAEGPLGPMTLAEPGRYIFACFLPTGGPPAEIFAAIDAFVAAGAPEGGAPDYPQTGPPHAVNGMVTEVTVTG